MDPQLEKFLYVYFENQFLKLTREEFQNWFVEIMEYAFPSDFVGTRQGTLKGGGDGGCDGFRISTGSVYAVYSPRHGGHAEVRQKIDDDFQTAFSKFGDRMKEWIFVHNERDEKLSTETLLALVDLQARAGTVRVGNHIGKSELWEIVRTLEPRIIHDSLGFPRLPSAGAIERLSMADLQPVLRFIERRPIPNDVPTNPPNERKLEHNSLEATIAEFLRIGRRRERLVEDYLNGCADVQLGEAIAQSFRDNYRRLRESNWGSDEIFFELYGLAGGFQLSSLMQQAAVWTVLSYYFERCDIFENPPE